MTKLEWKELPKVDSMSPFWWGSSWLFYQFERDKAVMHDENDDNIRTVKQLVSKTNFSRILSSLLCSERQMSLLSRFWRVRFLSSICSMFFVYCFQPFKIQVVHFILKQWNLQSTFNTMRLFQTLWPFFRSFEKPLC